MLPKIHRLTKKNDFDSVFEKGKSSKLDFLLIKWVKNNLQQSRFGFVVSKKISLKATVRNKVKRRLRQAVQVQLPDIHQSFDVVIVTLPGVQKAEFSDIQKIVGKFFEKLI